MSLRERLQKATQQAAQQQAGLHAPAAQGKPVFGPLLSEGGVHSFNEADAENLENMGLENPEDALPEAIGYALGQNVAQTSIQNLPQASHQQISIDPAESLRQSILRPEASVGLSRGPQFDALKAKIHAKLVDNLNLQPNDTIERNDVALVASQFLEEYLSLEKIPMSRQDREGLIQELVEEILGLGPLEPLLRDPGITEILVNGPRKVYVERNGKLEKTAVTFRDDAHVMHIIDRIVSAVGRRIDEKTPMVDARLKDGSRFNAIIPPLSLDGPSISIRKFKSDAGTMQKLLDWRSLTPAMAKALEIAIKAHLNIIISGGTGSGKTTLLNSLSGLISPDERIVTIEDSAELQLKQDHIVRLETRPANIEGHGAIHARQLLINALRMRPDRIIVGECRSGEALDMLQAMNTGHDGSLTTLHANAPRDALSRIETMCLMNDNPLPEKTIRQQIASAVHLIVQVSRLQDGSRKVVSITEIAGIEGEMIQTQELFKFEQTGIDSKGRVIGRHRALGIRPRFAELCEAKGIQLPENLFQKDPLPEANPLTQKTQLPKPSVPVAGADESNSLRSRLLSSAVEPEPEPDFQLDLLPLDNTLPENTLLGGSIPTLNPEDLVPETLQSEPSAQNLPSSIALPPNMLLPWQGFGFPNPHKEPF